MRVPAEDIKQVAQVVDGHQYMARNGFFDMRDDHARLHLKASDYGNSWAIAPPPQAAGYRCACGHGSWFRTCGKCGATCTREGETP